MPLNDIIAGIDDRPDYTEDEPPTQDNSPPKTPAETSMRTGATASESRMLPPYLHIQNVQARDWTMLAMAGTVLTLSRYLGELL